MQQWEDDAGDDDDDERGARGHGVSQNSGGQRATREKNKGAGGGGRNARPSSLSLSPPLVSIYLPRSVFASVRWREIADITAGSGS